MYSNEQNNIFIEYFKVLNEYLYLKSVKSGLNLLSSTKFLSDKKVEKWHELKKKDGFFWYF
jgi:hypothetical protein